MCRWREGAGQVARRRLSELSRPRSCAGRHEACSASVSLVGFSADDVWPTQQEDRSYRAWRQPALLFEPMRFWRLSNPARSVPPLLLCASLERLASLHANRLE